MTFRTSCNQTDMNDCHRSTYTSSLSSRCTDSCKSLLISSNSSFKNLFCKEHTSMAPSTLSPVIPVWTATEHFPMPPVLQSSSWCVSSTIAPSFALIKAIMVIKITDRKWYYLFYQNISNWDTSPMSCNHREHWENRSISLTYKTQLHLSPVYFYLKYNRSFIHSFIHSIGICRMWPFLAVLRIFLHSSLLCTFSCHPSPPTILHPPSPHLAIYFLVYLLILLFPNSYTPYFFDR